MSNLARKIPQSVKREGLYIVKILHRGSIVLWITGGDNSILDGVENVLLITL